MYAYCYLGKEHIVYHWFEQRRDGKDWLKSEVDLVRYILKNEPMFGIVTNKEFETMVAPVLGTFDPKIMSSIKDNKYISVRKIHPKIIEAQKKLQDGYLLGTEIE